MSFNDVEEVAFLPCVASPMTAKDIIISSRGCCDLFSSVVETLSSLKAIAKINCFYYKVTAEFRRQFAFSKNLTTETGFEEASGRNSIRLENFRLTTVGESV